MKKTTGIESPNVKGQGFFKSSLLALLVLVFAILSSCTKNLDDFGPQLEGEDTAIPTNKRVIVINEGNFMFGNGSISVIDSQTEEVAQAVFKVKNGFPLGDVPQSILMRDSLAYIVVNNSGKIEVVRSDDFSSVKTITGFTSPRHLTVVNESGSIGWVTDLYANKIWKVDLTNGKIIGNIPSKGWSENILSWRDKVLVLNKKDSVINVFDAASEQLIQSIGMAEKIVDFKLWNANSLMVMSPSGIFSLNLNTLTLTENVKFSPFRTPSRMAVDTVLNMVYFLDKDVYKYNSAVQKVIQATNGSNFYGLEASAATGEIFVTDAKDYVQPGEVLKYSSDFSDSVIFKVGVNPQFVVVE